MVHDIHLIVDRLREYKFEENLTLVTFDEKSGMDLLETVNNVLKDLSPKDHSVDVRDEPIERTAQRIFYFMPILKYDFQGDLDALQALLQEGAKEDFFLPAAAPHVVEPAAAQKTRVHGSVSDGF